MYAFKFELRSICYDYLRKLRGGMYQQGKLAEIRRGK